MKNGKFHTDDVKKCCERKLKIEFKAGKELNGWFIHNKKRITRITIPKGRKPIPPKTYKSMAIQLRLNTEQFDLLLECPLKFEDYIKIIFG